MFGGEMKLPVDVYLVPRQVLGPEPRQYVQNILQRLKVIHDRVKKNNNTETTQQESKERNESKTI